MQVNRAQRQEPRGRFQPAFDDPLAFDANPLRNRRARYQTCPGPAPPGQIEYGRVVNLLERQVEVYSEPSGAADEPDYRKRQDYGAADEVPVVLEGREVKRILVAELLP